MNSAGPRGWEESCNVEDIEAFLAYVCQDFNTLRDDLGGSGGDGGGESPLLVQLRDAFAAGAPLDSHLDAIDLALKKAGDALGLYGRIDPESRGNGTRLPGVGPRPPLADDSVIRCPDARCSRVIWAGNGPVQCALSGRPLCEGRP